MKTKCFFRLRRPAFRLLYYSAPIILTLSLSAATNDLTSALQRGPFEEEANHNLEAAAQAYQTVSAQFDKDRKLAATAIFRLGEVYRKQGKTNEAVVQYERIVREFSDQETLATLSRQNLAGQGATQPSNAVANDLKPERTGTANEGGQLAAQLSALERLEGDPEKQARAVYGMFPDEGLGTMLQNLPLLKEQLAKLGPNPVSDGVKSWNFTVGPNGNSVGGFGNVSGFHPQKEIDGQLSLIAKRVDFILGVQKARLQVLHAAEPRTPVSDRAAVERSAPSTDEEEKVKEIRRLQRALFKLRWPTKTPEQVRRQIEAARTAQQQKLDAATHQMESLRVSLSVPDDIAVMDADKGMDDPRLVQYRAYFEAKSTRDGVRRFGQVLYAKLATEEIELDLFRQFDALDD